MTKDYSQMDDEELYREAIKMREAQAHPEGIPGNIGAMRDEIVSRWLSESEPEPEDEDLVADAGLDASDQDKLRVAYNAACDMLGSGILYELLTQGSTDGAIEPVMNTSPVHYWYQADKSDEWVYKRWSREPDILDTLERILFDALESDVQSYTEHDHSTSAYLQGVEESVGDYPTWIATQYLEEERLNYETSGHRDDLRAHIGLCQIEFMRDLYPKGRDETDNLQDRLKSWMYLLNYVQFKVSVHVSEDSAGGRFDKLIWETSEDAAKSEAERRVSSNEAVKEIDEVKSFPMKREKAGKVNDPLPDAEEFVYNE
jgi:hypothetical protein